MGIPVTVAATVLMAGFVSVASGGDLEKKLICFGWDIKSPAELQKRAGTLQDIPFDGLTVRDTRFCYTFYNTPISEADVEKTIDIVKNTSWGKFTDNFIYMTAAETVDWFDDAAWAENGKILSNIRTLARVANAGRFKGILFDPEFVYWKRPHGVWKYKAQAHYENKSFAEYEAMVRKRGALVMNTIEKEFPNPVFLSLFWGSIDQYKVASFKFDPKISHEVVKEQEYGLLNAFFCGMLEAADPGTVIVDGNEYSYWYSDMEQYLRAFHFIRQRALRYIPVELRQKYIAQVRCGHSVFIDKIANTLSRQTSASCMTPEERALWMEFNTYWALRTSDKYVWAYSQRIHHLDEEALSPPKGFIEAMNRAKQKVHDATKGNPPKFAPIIARAWKAFRQAETSPIPTASADITKLNDPPPVIDGKLDDAAWTNATKLTPFHNYRAAVSPLTRKTFVRVTYDDENLYLGFRCEEIKEGRQLEPSSFPNLKVRRVDQVAVAIPVDERAKQHFHIMIDAFNNRWDALASSDEDGWGTDDSWTGQFDHRTFIGPKDWFVEMAIPWKTLSRNAPKANETHKVNLHAHRDRGSHGNYEFSSWSQARKARGVEIKQLGTWTFKQR